MCGRYKNVATLHTIVAIDLVILGNSNGGQGSTGSSITELDEELVMICCDECGEYVPADNWFEHTDYHVATKLQKSINQSSPGSVLSPPQPARDKAVSKGSSKNKMASKKPKLLTLDKFLTKK